MPELPEVEIVRLGLCGLIIDKRFAKVSSDNPKSFPNDLLSVNSFLVGASVKSVNRRAKVLLIELSSGYTLMIHLRMTGQIVFVPVQNKSKSDAEGRKNKQWGAGHPNDSLIGKLPDKSTRVTFDFYDGAKLYFNDQRKFGWVKLMPTSLVSEDSFMMKVGPEPLEREFTNKIFVQRMRKRNGTSVKAAILDQTILAGVGNIYADESLWAAKISPGELVKNISDERLKLLHHGIVRIMKLAIEKGGSTSRNYVNAEGIKGSYLDFAMVFRREGQSCFRCGNTILKTRVAGRGTHTCPVCQPQGDMIGPR